MIMFNILFHSALFSLVGTDLFLLLSGVNSWFFHKLTFIGLLTACTNGCTKVLLVLFLIFILYKGEPTK